MIPWQMPPMPSGEPDPEFERALAAWIGETMGEPANPANPFVGLEFDFVSRCLLSVHRAPYDPLAGQAISPEAGQ